MSVCFITGVGGLVGSEAAEYFSALGMMDIVGIDNDMRARLFGPEASVAWRLREIRKGLRHRFDFWDVDIRDQVSMHNLFGHYGKSIDLIVHAAAQPSHDWAATEPMTDFDINARATLRLLEMTRQYAPDAVFVFCSTNKVYGDNPNRIKLEEYATRYEVANPCYWCGIDEFMGTDQCLHSLFGASKLAADTMVQEYGRYFGLRTACFRGGCLTGPAHVGAEQHGFLAYLMRCAVEGKPYTVYGYKGKQVRDNLHARDLVRAFHEFYKNPRPGAVYNIGGGRANSVSVLEAIEHCQRISERELNWSYSPEARTGDHKWWITDMGKFEHDYPDWKVRIGLTQILEEIYEATSKRSDSAPA